MMLTLAPCPPEVAPAARKVRAAKFGQIDDQLLAEVCADGRRGDVHDRRLGGDEHLFGEGRAHLDVEGDGLRHADGDVLLLHALVAGEGEHGLVVTGRQQIEAELTIGVRDGRVGAHQGFRRHHGGDAGEGLVPLIDDGSLDTATGGLGHQAPSRQQAHQSRDHKLSTHSHTLTSLYGKTCAITGFRKLEPVFLLSSALLRASQWTP
jgi:hypothetical protein